MAQQACMSPPHGPHIPAPPPVQASVALLHIRPVQQICIVPPQVSQVPIAPPVQAVPAAVHCIAPPPPGQQA
jgi:hypothetical protein